MRTRIASRWAWHRLAALALPGMLALAFYAPALHFGFFNDDPSGHFRWMAGRSILSFFVDAGGHGYYRPVSFVLWQILYKLLGRHDAFVLHLLNVLTHATNAVLVSDLARRLAKFGPARPSETRQGVCLHAGWRYGLAAGVLFAVYPFSYEAVPYVGAFVHPLVTLFSLASLNLYLAWRASRQRKWFVAAHLALTLALFTQENGVIVPLLLLVLGWWTGERLDPREQAPGSPLRLGLSPQAFSTVSFLVEPLVFGLVWLWTPKASHVERVISLPAAQANLWPFVQALVYPLAPLAQARLIYLAALAAVALAALYGLAHGLRQTRALTFGVLVWGLAAMPSILLLDPAYVAGSPRLFYLGSVGVALLWALPAQLAVQNFRFRVPTSGFRVPSLRGSLLTPYFLLPTSYSLLLTPYFLLLTSSFLPYTTCQLRYQGYAGQVGRMMAEATYQAHAGQAITFVNLPYFFGSRGAGSACQQPFTFAPTGAVVIPPYADVRDFGLYNGGLDRPARAVSLDDYAPGWATHGQAIDAAGLRQALTGSHVFVFDLLAWRLHDLSAVWRPSSAIATSPPLARLGTGFQLQQATVSQIETQLMVTLTWQAVDTVEHDYSVFTQALDASGQVIAQHDGPPAAGLAATRLWQTGDMVTDTHSISLPSPSSAVRLIAGMYDPASGLRLAAIDANGARLPDDAVTVWTPATP